MGLTIYDETRPYTLTGYVIHSDGLIGTDLGVTNEDRLRVDHILCVNADTIDHHFVVTLSVNNHNADLGTVTVAAGVGTAGVVAADLIPLLLPASMDGIILDRNSELVATNVEEASAGKTISFQIFGGYF